MHIKLLMKPEMPVQQCTNTPMLKSNATHIQWMLWFVLLISAVGADAQTLWMEKAKTYYRLNSPEKVSLHLNQHLALAGDTIRFKGYILHSNGLSSISTVLYADLVDNRGYLVQTKRFPIANGLTLGQFEIPSNLSAGLYHIRAYTAYQLNFAGQQFFEMPVTVVTTASQQYPSIANINSRHTTTAAFDKGLSIVATDSPKGPYYVISCEDSCQYLDSTLNINFISPAISSHLSFTPTQTKRSRDIFFPSTAHFAGNEIDVVVTNHNNEVLVQDKLFLKAKRIEAKLRTDTLNISPGGYNSWLLEIPDINLASLSIAITDAHLDNSAANIANSSSYWPLAYQNIMSDTIEDTLKKVDQNYIKLTGAARRASKRQPIINKNILAFITTKDSARNFYIIPTDTAGRFELKGLVFYDTATFQFQLQDKTARAKDLELILDWTRRPLFTTDSNHYSVKLHNNLQQTEFIKAANKHAAQLLEQKGKVLAEVIVVAEKKTTIELIQEEYTAGAFRGNFNSKSFDLINERMLVLDIFDYIRTKVPGIETNDTGISHRRQNVLLFVNEMPVDMESFKSIHPSQVAFVMFHPAPFAGAMLMQAALCIYTKKGSALEIPDPAVLGEVRIKAKKGSHKKLDNDYTSGMFSGPADYAIDLRSAKDQFDLFAFMKQKIPGFNYAEKGAVVDLTYFNKKPLFFIDEREPIDGMELQMYRHRVNFLAYAKVIGNFPSAEGIRPAIALYTRKGKDINDAFDGLLAIEVPGFDKINDRHLPSEIAIDSSAARINVYWNPLAGHGKFPIRFYNNGFSKKLRIVVEGINTFGEWVYWENVLTPGR